MEINLSDYEVTNGANFKLATHSTSPKDRMSDDESKEIIRKNVRDIADIQERMYANQQRNALFIFQAIDAAGKDGTIERLLTGINPQGVMVSSFKRPTPEELSHDFLWRVQLKLPPKGIIGVFNRSHYEEVLVVKVHPNYLMPQNLPGIKSVADVNNEFWETRYRNIREFEQRLADNGTFILKFFLYVSKDEQKKRLLSRMEEKDKHWKFKADDIKERPHWQEYLDAYEQAIRHTATPSSPWYVIPADHKDTMRAIVTTIAKKKLEEIKEDWPSGSPNILEELEEGRRLLNEE